MNRRYLSFISQLQKIFKPLGFDIAVGGGLAYDAFIGKLTRPHDDLDIDVLGNLDWQTGFDKVYLEIKKIFPGCQKKKDRLIISQGKFVVDLEYVAKVNPQTNTYQYAESAYTFPLPLYLENRGKIGRYVFTIEDPHLLFNIKLLQPILGQKSHRPKDHHDIKLIRPHLDFQKLLIWARFELDYFAKQKI